MIAANGKLVAIKAVGSTGEQCSSGIRRGHQTQQRLGFRSSDCVDQVPLCLSEYSCRLGYTLTTSEPQIAEEKESTILTIDDRRATLAESWQVQRSTNRSTKLIDVELRLAQPYESWRS